MAAAGVLSAMAVQHAGAPSHVKNGDWTRLSRLASFSVAAGLLWVLDAV